MFVLFFVLCVWVVTLNQILATVEEFLKTLSCLQIGVQQLKMNFC